MANLGFLNQQKMTDAKPDDFDAIPEGTYNVKIVSSAMKENKSGTGEFLNLELEIMGPSQIGRKTWINLNLVHENTKAVEIAYKELAKLCDVCGVNRNLSDSQQLHGKPFQVDIVQDGSYTRCKNIKPSGSSKPEFAPPMQPIKQPAGSAPPGWPSK